MGRRPQEGQVSFAPKISTEDSLITVQGTSALHIYGKYQGLRHRDQLYAINSRGTKVFLVEMLDPRRFPTGSMNSDQFQLLSGSTDDFLLIVK